MTRTEWLSKSYILHIIFLTFFAMLMFLPGLKRLPVVERDEAHFAQASRQMVQTGHYFQVRFQDITRFQKPPGINWLQAGVVQRVSDGDASSIWPYRLPSFLGAWFSVLLTYYFSRRFVHSRTAVLAACFLASSLLLVVEAHMAVIDACLLCAVVLMQGSLWIIFSEGIKRHRVSPLWGWLFWLAMALGFVLKGVTPLVGFLSIIMLCCMSRQTAWLRGVRWVSGGLLFMVLTLAWLFAVNVAENNNYLLQMIHHDLLPKLQGGHESHGKPPLFHLFLLPVMFWPASLFLWQAGMYAYRYRYNEVVQFLMAWILPTWIFFEIMPTKLPQYVLPTFPAIALLAALAIEQTAFVTRGLRLLQSLWGLLSVGLGLALCFLSYALFGHITRWSILTASVISVLSIGCVVVAWRGNFWQAALGVLLMTGMTVPMVFSGLLPDLKPLWLSKTIAEETRRFSPSALRPLFVSGYYAEPGIVFYLNTQFVVFTGSDSEAIRRCMVSESFALVSERSLSAFQFVNPVIVEIQGFNYSKGQWVQLILLQCKN